MTKTIEVDPTELTAEQLAEILDDPIKRLNTLYKIIIKGDNDEDGLVITFKPNRAQRRLLSRMHNRNIILKARQLGFTTLACILWLDTALFSSDPIRCGIIAQDREAAESLFRTKVKFAYENLPDALREKFPLSKSTASELEFEHNGSSIRVATSMRSGTIHRLHISEFGKICAKYPDKAKEVITGSIPAVPKSGVLIIESTAEGQDGAFYEMTERAKALAQQSVILTEKDYRFHFFAWWEAPEYQLDPELVVMTEVHNRYFNDIESKIKRIISMPKRAWYVATLNSDFNGDQSLMWQEYPSTPEEAFQVSTEGCYYANQIALARKEGRIVTHLPKIAVPVNTFWDIGKGDATAIWFHQRVGMENRWLKYYEASGEDFDHFTAYMQEQGYTYGRHYLPHDAQHKRMAMNKATSRSCKEMLEALLPGQRFEIVPVCHSITAAIQATRNVFNSCYFDETGCFEGIKRLSNYKKEWDKTRGTWRADPRHDENSHGADAFRQFGQEADAGNMFPGGASTSAGGFKRRGSAMAV